MITESVKTILGEGPDKPGRSGLEGQGQGRKGRGPGRRKTTGPSSRPKKFNGANSGKTSAENALKAAADPAEYERVHYFNAI